MVDPNKIYTQRAGYKVFLRPWPYKSKQKDLINAEYIAVLAKDAQVEGTNYIKGTDMGGIDKHGKYVFGDKEYDVIDLHSTFNYSLEE